MIEEEGFLRWAFYGFLTVCITIIGFFTKRVVEDVSDLKSDGADCRLNHEKLRTHISENYATKIDVNSSRLETNETLKRLHERIDHLPRDIISLLRKEQ